MGIHLLVTCRSPIATLLKDIGVGGVVVRVDQVQQQVTVFCNDCSLKPSIGVQGVPNAHASFLYVEVESVQTPTPKPLFRSDGVWRDCALLLGDGSLENCSCSGTRTVASRSYLY